MSIEKKTLGILKKDWHLPIIYTLSHKQVLYICTYIHEAQCAFVLFSKTPYPSFFTVSFMLYCPTLSCYKICRMVSSTIGGKALFFLGLPKVVIPTTPKLLAFTTGLAAFVWDFGCVVFPPGLVLSRAVRIGLLILNDAGQRVSSWWPQQLLRYDRTIN